MSALIQDYNIARAEKILKNSFLELTSGAFGEDISERASAHYKQFRRDFERARYTTPQESREIISRNIQTVRALYKGAGKKKKIPGNRPTINGIQSTYSSFIFDDQKSDVLEIACLGLHLFLEEVKQFLKNPLEFEGYLYDRLRKHERVLRDIHLRLE